MLKIILIKSVEGARKVVQHILTAEKIPIIGISCKKSSLDGSLLVLTISTCSDRIYVFDVKEHDDIMIEGTIIRLLQCLELKKVMHDCAADCGLFFNNYDIKINNVFDTQVVYSMNMVNAGLPSRTISLHDLYKKYGNLDNVVRNNIQNEIYDSTLYWSQRPLSEYMILAAAVESVALMPDLYNQLLSTIEPNQMEIFESICEETVKSFYRTTKPSISPRPSTRTPTRADIPIMVLNGKQLELLEKTRVDLKREYVIEEL